MSCQLGEKRLILASRWKLHVRQIFLLALVSPTWLHELQNCVNRDGKHAAHLPMSAVQAHKNQNDHFISYQCNELYTQRVCDICCRWLKVDFKLLASQIKLPCGVFDAF